MQENEILTIFGVQEGIVKDLPFRQKDGRIYIYSSQRIGQVKMTGEPMGIGNISFKFYWQFQNRIL